MSYKIKKHLTFIVGVITGAIVFHYINLGFGVGIVYFTGSLVGRYDTLDGLK